MIGRAGRPQFDTSATAVIFVQEKKKQFYKKFLHEPFPVESSLHLCLHEHLNADVANGTVRSAAEAVDYLTWTYLYRRLLKNPSYYNVQYDEQEGGSLDDAVRAHLEQMVLRTLRELQDAACLYCDTDEQGIGAHTITNAAGSGRDFAVQSRPWGHVASLYYLRYTSPHAFSLRLQEHQAQMLQQDPGTALASLRLLHILTSTSEFSEIPVRHNEEHLNAQLAHDLRDTQLVQQEDMLSPHVKTFLMLLAHMQRAPLPIADYINDLKSVLDQLPRILNAMVDVAGELGYMLCVRQLARLSQCISNAVSISSELAELEQVAQGQQNVHALVNIDRLRAAISGRSQSSGSIISGLRALGATRAREILADCIRTPEASSWSKSLLEGIFTAWPLVLSAQGTLRPVDSQEEGASLKEGVSPMSLVPGAQYELNLQLQVRSGAKGGEKGKKNSWWVAVGLRSPQDNPASEELLALKRVGNLKGRVGSSDITCSLRILIPASYSGSALLSLHALGDGVLGGDFERQWSVIMQQN
eukprot:gene39650-48269_t